MDQGDRPRLGGVFYVSLGLAAAFVLWGVLSTQTLAGVSGAIRGYVLDTFGWMYLFSVFGFLLLALFLALSRYGGLRLGEGPPEFGWLSWFAMLFSAGVGMSFLFWGISEPVIHLAEPPHGIAESGSAEAALLGMRYSYFFWGLHPWSIYAIVAVAIGYSAFRRGNPLLVSSALRPLLGSRMDGPLGKAIDVLAVFAILFGVATSLGLGTRQLNSGLGHLFGMPDAYGVKVAIIASLMGICAISAITGLARGIRLLSLSSLVISGLLLLFVLIFGPTLFLLNLFTSSLGGYLQNFLRMSFDSGNFGVDGAWSESWTFFFWAWWISWSPFVGSFIARISRGRTIREVIAGAMLAPSSLTFLWFSVFGGTALNLDLLGEESLAAAAQGSKSVATFETLGVLPLPLLTSILIVFVVALYFITSADSASFMLGSTTSGGTMKPRAPVKLMWSFFGGAFTAVLLLTGERATLYGAAIIAGVPFTLVLILMCVTLCRCLIYEEFAERITKPAEESAADEREPRSPVGLRRDH